jgi:ABC-type dipeptide/oligopeptide/nickel transport system permease component
MKTFRVIPTLFFLMFIFTSCILQAQQNQPSSEILSQSQVSATINDAVRKQFGIDFTITRVYKYVDRLGQYYCVLTERFDSLAKDEEGKYDTLHFAIRAIDLR